MSESSDKSEPKNIPDNLILMKQSDIKLLRDKLWKFNNGICPLLNIYVPQDKTVLDHIHKLINDDCSEQKGTIRNAIDFRANAIEGKITNSYKRYFGSDESTHPIKLSDFLRNLADYLDVGAYVDENGNYHVHPNEVPKPKPVSKRNYNKLKRMSNAEEFVPKRKNQKKKKFPEYPKSKKLTKELKLLFTKFNISPFN